MSVLRLWLRRLLFAGYELLKKKRDALKKRFHTLCKSLSDVSPAPQSRCGV
jgi:vacuolar-type H+-ATPase subunit D/Vma8